jgi:hypothetical protein
MRRLSLSATLAILVLAGLMPATVAAAPVMTFGNGYTGLVLRSHCINGHGPANAPVHVVWKSQGGTVKAVADVTSTASGAWEYCSSSRRLAVGDTIRASSASYARTFTMPNITLTGNRETGAFRGRGLPGVTGDLWYHAGIFADYFENAQVTAGSDGRWVLPQSDGSGASGGIQAEVFWTTPQGDVLIGRTVTPYVEVTIGRAFVSGGTQANSSAVVSLRDPVTDALRGRASTTSDDYGFFDGRFVNPSGQAVNTRVGDRVVSALSGSIDWHVPNIEGSADVANDMVNGRCHSTEIEALFALVRVYRTGDQRGLAIASVDAAGTFEIDFGGREGLYYDPANIKHGDRIVISCYYDATMDDSADDIVSFPFFVP